MKKTILIFSIFFISGISHAELTGKLNLSCRQKELQPLHYQAVISGPSAVGVYKLTFTENYYGAVITTDFSLKAENANRLLAEKASVSEVNIINGRRLLEIKTDKAGPVKVICD